jgi:hypothetical protein
MRSCSWRWTWVVAIAVIVATAPPAFAESWREVYRSPYEVAGFPAIDVRTERDVWLVGGQIARVRLDTSFTVHLVGSAWKIVPTPEPPGQDWFLADIAVVDGSTAWAVGGAGRSALVLRWDGSVWRRVPTPRIAGNLQAVDRIPGTRNVVTVGWTTDTFSGPLVLRWTGTRWRRPRLPQGVRYGSLSGVDAVSRRTAWAVGQVGGRSLILQRTHHGWHRVASPELRGRPLHDVAALGRDRAFALAGSTTVVRWNGVGWRTVSRTWPRAVQLQGLDAAGGVAWVTGTHPGRTSSAQIRPFAMRWRGAWRRDPVPRIANAFGDVAVGPSCVWTVGPFSEGESNAGVFRRCR